MKMIITGGAGFIGSSFVSIALDAGHQTLVLDALTYSGNLANLDGAKGNGNYRFVRGDIRDKKLVDRLFREFEPDAVVNLAAETHVDRSIMDASPFIETNVGGVQVLLDAVRKFPNTKYLQVSTDEVYGSADDGLPFVEDSPLKPSSPYSASKASADLLALSYFKTYGLNVVITRCSNNYGPRQFPEKLIPLFVTNLLQGQQVPVYGDGMNVRDWIHRDDHSRGLLAALFGGKPGEVYNFGGGTPRSNMAITKALLSLTGHDESMIKHVKDRPGHDKAYLIDHGKATRKLGWTPSVEFGEGLRGTVEWYKQNVRWWSEIRTGEYLEYYNKQYGEQP